MFPGRLSSTASCGMGGTTWFSRSGRYYSYYSGAGWYATFVVPFTPKFSGEISDSVVFTQVTKKNRDVGGFGGCVLGIDRYIGSEHCRGFWALAGSSLVGGSERWQEVPLWVSLSKTQTGQLRYEPAQNSRLPAPVENLGRTTSRAGSAGMLPRTCTRACFPQCLSFLLRCF